jgi:geranyl-CoA carboxylase alpha subunit
MRTLLVANRGEIALRIARSARRLGLRTVGVCSDADRDAPHTRGFDLCLPIGASYLDIGALVDAARRAGADALHPGYGFRSEDPALARAVLDAGLTWVGPPPDAMAAMADKGEARRRAAALGVPVLPGFDGTYASLDELHERALPLGLPLMVKAAAGGGGRGMRRVDDLAALREALASAEREARAAFGDGRLIVERALDDPRHVEVQVFGDRRGGVVHLGERDCSVQRRHQKLLEEAPCPALDAAARRRLGDVAVRLARDIGYVGAGTVEFLLGADGAFHFMEMNTRLQVEHPVTEALLGIDLVEWQLRIAAGEPLPLAQDELLRRFESGGHAIEARLCAEDPSHQFAPCTGTVVRWSSPLDVRCDHALADGLVVGPDYDPMLAKLIAHGPTRAAALAQLAGALERTVLHGVGSNRAWLARLLRGDAFRSGRFGTGFVAGHRDDADAPSWLVALGAAAFALGGDAPSAWLGWTSNAHFECELPLRVDEADAVQRWRIAGSARGGWRVACGEAHHLVEMFDASRTPGLLHARIDGRDVVAACTRHGTTAWLQADGHEVALSDERHVAAAARRVEHAGALHAPMHGRLLRVSAEGTRVERGDVLAVIEAMKIEHALPAPRAGTVRAVHARAGQQVAARALLLELEPAS